MYTIEIFEHLAGVPATAEKSGLFDGKGGQVELLYRDLKTDLLCAKFGPGERLIEERLAKQYTQSSRTPVREALARLKSEGHIGVRGRSFINPEYSSESLLQLYDVRLSMEVLAVRGAAGTEDITDLSRCIDLMAEAQKNRNHIAVNAADGLFHLKIAEMTGNVFLSDILSKIHEKVFQIRNLIFIEEAQQDDIVGDHKLILSAIEGGVPEVAGAEMAHHLSQSRQKFKNRMI